MTYILAPAMGGSKQAQDVYSICYLVTIRSKMASSSGDPVSPFKRLLACCSGSSQNEPLEAGGVRPYSADTAIESRRHGTEAASGTLKLTEGALDRACLGLNDYASKQLYI